MVLEQGFKPLQWKPVGRPEVDSWTYRILVFDGSGNVQIHGKGHRCNKWFWNNYIFMWNGIKLHPYLSSPRKVNSSYLKDLNMKNKILNYYYRMKSKTYL